MGGGSVFVWEERVFGVGGAGVWCWRAGVLVWEVYIKCELTY